MAAKYEPTNKTYSVETIEQLFSLVTKENLPYLMADIYKTAELMVNLDQINKIACEAANEKYEKLRLPVFNWVDDGKNNLNEVMLSSTDGSVNFNLSEALKDAKF